MNHNKIWKTVQNCLKNDFTIPANDLITYVCVHQHGCFDGQNIDLLRILKKDKGQELAIKSYRDLDSHQELILFKGRIFKDGGLCLSNIGCGFGSENDLTRKEVVGYPG